MNTDMIHPIKPHVNHQTQTGTLPASGTCGQPRQTCQSSCEEHPQAHQQQTSTVRPDFGQKRYHSLDFALKQQFGQKLYKISLDGGMTCPNRDGTLGTGGCIFCSAGGSGEFAPAPGLSVTEQIEAGKQVFCEKNLKDAADADTRGQQFIAYFQSFTNTYAPTARLRQLFTEAIDHPDIAALSIGTRPDCLPPDVIDLLAELNERKPVWVELGLQTIHDRTASLIRRGYPLSVFEDALARLKAAGLTVIVHVILGLPGETADDMLATADYLAHAGIDGIKLQLMHVLRGTDLEQFSFPLFSMEEYVDILIRCIEHLDPAIVIHRITGDGPKDLLVAPLWSADKRKVLNTIHHEMKVRDSWQGKQFFPG